MTSMILKVEAHRTYECNSSTVLFLLLCYIKNNKMFVYLPNLCRMFVKGLLMMAYLYIYDNWRIYELPWDSAVTWVIAAILVDLGYYWVHRAAHGK